MTGVFIVPTGIGCEIGGHAGDATPAAKLIASVCDELIIHPNVVNASDINEMTKNMLYVEGSMLDRFLEGRIEGLRRVRSNRILVVVNPPILNDTVNAVSAARATMGVNAEMLILNTPLKMIGYMKDGMATGDVDGWQELVEQVSLYDFDALAITTLITVGEGVEIEYFKNGGVNPWGGVEAKASRLISEAINRPSAHSPTSVGPWIMEIVDPRMAAEMVSMSFLFCILKGLHKAPQIGSDLTVNDIDFLITPIGCVGRPHKACLKANIPIIVVKENATVLNETLEKCILVENYWEAAGVISCMKSGIEIMSVRRPIPYTKVYG